MKALLSTTKTAEKQGDAIKNAFKEHAKLCKVAKEDLMFGPLLAKANEKLSSGTAPAAAASSASSAEKKPKKK